MRYSLVVSILILMTVSAGCRRVEVVQLSHPPTARLLDHVDRSVFDQHGEFIHDGVLVVPSMRDLGHSASPRVFFHLHALDAKTVHVVAAKGSTGSESVQLPIDRDVTLRPDGEFPGIHSATVPAKFREVPGAPDVFRAEGAKLHLLMGKPPHDLTFELHREVTEKVIPLVGGW